jgi:uncharacterized protein YndB with AHSA1/START domain
MKKSATDAASSTVAATLVVRRQIKATPEKLFAAWTRPELLMCWWGPEGVACPAAEIDLRVGGSYRIANRFPDGNIIWIAGMFEEIDAPRRLVYTWKLQSQTGPPERVTVCFVSDRDMTEVVITHERIPNEAARTGHERGWAGCLDGLVKYIERL